MENHGRARDCMRGHRSRGHAARLEGRVYAHYDRVSTVCQYFYSLFLIFRLAEHDEPVVILVPSKLPDQPRRFASQARPSRRRPDPVGEFVLTVGTGESIFAWGAYLAQAPARRAT